MIFVNETSKLHYQGIDQLLQEKSPKFISACRRACMMLAQKGFTEKREKSCFLILSEPSPPPPTMCTMMACPHGEQLFGKVEPNHGVPAAVGVHDQHTLLGLRTH
jgi:hypothetical protein